MFADWSLFAKR